MSEAEQGSTPRPTVNPSPTVHPRPADGSSPATTPTAWLGWVLFAGLMLILVGLFNVIEGIAAVAGSDFLVTTATGLIVLDLTTWGWVHLAVGVLQLAAGAGILAGAKWAMALGILLAMLNAALQLLSMPIYPAWSVVVIAVDVLVIWALAVHGRELRELMHG